MAEIADLDAARERAERQRLRLPLASGGEPPHDSGMEARVAVLEEIAKGTKEMLRDIRAEGRAMRDQTAGNFAQMRADQRQDFRLTWGGLICIALGLAGLMAKGFHWL